MVLTVTCAVPLLHLLHLHSAARRWKYCKPHLRCSHSDLVAARMANATGRTDARVVEDYLCNFIVAHGN